MVKLFIFFCQISNLTHLKIQHIRNLFQRFSFLFLIFNNTLKCIMFSFENPLLDPFLDALVDSLLDPFLDSLLDSLLIPC